MHFYVVLTPLQISGHPLTVPIHCTHLMNELQAWLHRARWTAPKFTLWTAPRRPSRRWC